ncbi:MAG: AsmA family protein, partial [Desulfobacteraceae bacterium]|nr:AsmA family protein [Desulfobacteraceae bacterium]
FSGISIENFRVRMRDKDQNFIAAESMVLKYRLWPLLKKQVVIDEMRLENPEINVIRNKDKTFNFSDLMEEKEKPAKKAPSEAPKKEGGPPVQLLVSKVRINNGNLRFTDRAAGDEPFSYSVSRFNVSADNISLAEAFPVDIEARLNEAPFSVSAEVDPGQKKVKADVSLKELNIDDFEAYFKERMPARISGAKLDIDISARAGPESMRSSGTVRIAEADIEMEEMPEASMKDARFGIDYDISADLASERLSISKAEMDANGIVMTASGKVTSYGSAPQLDIAFNLPETGMQKILSAMPAGLAKKAEKMEPAGAIKAEFHFAGAADKPKQLLKNGKVSLDRVSAAAGGMKPALTGDINLTSEKISAKELRAELGKDTAYMDMEVTRFYSKPVYITHSLRAKSLDLDALTAGAKKSPDSQKKKKKKREEDKKAGKDKKRGEEKQIGPLDLPLHVTGRLDVDEARYKGMPVKDLKMRYTLIDNILTVETFSARAAEGKINMDARVDLGKKGPEYKSDITMQSIKTDQLITALYNKASGIISGTADMDGQFSGRGFRKSDIQKNLNGGSTMQISDGKLSGGDITAGLAQLLGISETRLLEFETFKGNLRIDSGKMRIDSNYDSSDVKMKPSGTLGLDGSLDIDLNLRLAPDVSSSLSKDSTLGRLLGDKEGWTRVPVSLKGSLSSPKFSLDRSQIKEEAGKKVMEKAVEKLFE